MRTKWRSGDAEAREASLAQLAGVNMAPAPVKDVPCQGEVAESGVVGLLEEPGAAARNGARRLQRLCLSHVCTPRYRKMAS
jgi:hypothetical protein